MVGGYPYPENRPAKRRHRSVVLFICHQIHEIRTTRPNWRRHFAEAVVCAWVERKREASVMAVSAARVSGIDVSHFQNEIDWEQVSRVGIVFAFIKATEGTSYSDPLFAANWRSAKAEGVLRGAYHFFRPQLDPQRQARFFLDTLKDDPGELPPVVDLEVLADVPPEEVIAGACEWMVLVSAALDLKPMLYTGSAFWRRALNNSTALTDYPLWIAHYTSARNPIVPSAWPQWTFWQFSQQGKVAGICGDVDLDVFNGTLDDLHALCSRRSQPKTVAAV